MALFIDSVCAADEPCSGRSETILTVFASPPTSSVPVPPASSSSPPHPAAMKAKAPTNRSRTAKSVLLLTPPPPQSPDLPLSPSARPSRRRKLSPGGPLLRGGNYDAAPSRQQAAADKLSRR